MRILKILAAVAAGIFFGRAAGISAAGVQAELLAAVLLAALDSVLGGICARLTKTFSDALLLSGFFVSVLFAAALIALGEILGLELYYIALLIFGLRIFKNLASIRNLLAQKYLG